MFEDKEELTGKSLTKKLKNILSLTDLMGIPIVTVFLMYNLSGSWDAFAKNYRTLGGLLIFAFVVIVLSVAGHQLSIKRSIRRTADFLDNDKQKEDESHESYVARVVDALDCALRFPLREASVSLVTWPITLGFILSISYFVFFKFPVSMMLLLVVGSLLAGALEAIFQFYIYKRALDSVRERLLTCYPHYWADENLKTGLIGLRRKMMVSFVSLTIVIVVIIGILNYMDANKAIMFQWGSHTKTRLTRELEKIGPLIELSESPKEYAEYMKGLDDGSATQLFLVNKAGEYQLPGEISDTMKAILKAIVERSYAINKNVLLAPFKKDADVLYSTEQKDLGVYVRVEAPQTDKLVIARTSYKDHKPFTARIKRNSIIFGVLAIIVSIFFTRITSDDITRPLDSVVNVVEKVGDGKLYEELNMYSQDELGVLALDFRGMMENLRAMILQISLAASSVENATFRIVEGFKKVSEGSRAQTSAVDETSSSMDEMNASIRGIGENVETLASTAQQSSSSIQQMSATIEEVAENVDNLSRSVEETTSSIGEMAASIRQVAENVENLSRKAESTVSSVTQMEISIKEVNAGAEETAQISELVAQNAEAGAKRVQSTIEGIGKARESSQHAVQVIQELAGRANEIGNILTVIDDVTDETNLLALNAAIIAAQAGEHGRGFAVVADEIKDLAERTAQSTEEINQLIEAVQGGAKEAVEAVGVGYKAVQEGVKLSQEAGEALAKILESSNKSTLRTHDIARATVEQAQRTKEVLNFFEEISDSIRQLEIATREQSKGSSQIMESAEQMSESTRQVKKATHEQSLGSKQITQAIENINQIVNFINRSQGEQITNTEKVVDAIQEIRSIAARNEEGVEEMFQASANLSSLAEDLRSLVETFKVNADKT